MNQATIRNYNKRGSYNFFEFSIPSILSNSTSEEYALSIAPVDFGNLIEVYVVCGSTNYTLSLRIVPGTTCPSIDEIFRAEEINLYENDTGFIIPFISSTIYAVVSNLDLVNATGEITIKLGMHG